MTIREYHKSDRAGVLGLLDSNTPDYFALSERADMEHYLDHELEDYFVVEKEGRIIGAGGINYVPEKKRAVLAWGMITPDLHGKGIGTILTKHRIEHINAMVEIESMIVRTTQLTYKFYEKMNFKLVKTQNDYWGEGFDLYHMEQKNKRQSSDI